MLSARRAGMPRREFTSQKALQRTSRGVLRPALLIPKAVLKALWEAELPFREALGIKRERKQLRTKRTAK
jgi:hypothetical protein